MTECPCLYFPGLLSQIMTAINFYSDSAVHLGSLGKNKSFDFCLRFECLLPGLFTFTNGKRNLSNDASPSETKLPCRIYWMLRYILGPEWAASTHIKSQHLKNICTEAKQPTQSSSKPETLLVLEIF